MTDVVGATKTLLLPLALAVSASAAIAESDEETLCRWIGLQAEDAVVFRDDGIERDAVISRLSSRFPSEFVDYISKTIDKVYNQPSRYSDPKTANYYAYSECMME